MSELVVDMPCLPAGDYIAADIIFVLPDRVAEEHRIDVFLVRERVDGQWRMKISYKARS